MSIRAPDVGGGIKPHLHLYFFPSLPGAEDDAVQTEGGGGERSGASDEFLSRRDIRRCDLVREKR